MKIVRKDEKAYFEPLSSFEPGDVIEIDGHLGLHIVVVGNANKKVICLQIATWCLNYFNDTKRARKIDAELHILG